jgi:hypothetical protein
MPSFFGAGWSHAPHPTTSELDGGVSLSAHPWQGFGKVLDTNNKVATLTSFKTLTPVLTSIVEMGRWACPQALKI